MAAATPVCENCVKGYRLPGEPTGEMIQVDGMPVYFRSAPADGPTPTGEKKAIVLMFDMFGLPMPNSQIVIDDLTKRLGADGFVPDVFLGSPPIAFEDLKPLLPDEPGHVRTIGEKLSFVWLILKNFRGMYNVMTSQSAIDARTVKFLETLRSRGYTRIGLFGYCFGGSIVYRIASTTDVATSVVIAHAGRLNVKDAANFKAPSSWIIPEDDEGLSDKDRDEIEAALRAKEPGIPTEWVTYPGTTHGFALRPNLGLPKVKEGFEKSLDQITTWFQKTL
ncbi:hypothetical protein FRB97_005816 [Tulasnella sp. 331]|nr:hypothetical protein FRB97_005816 [Tulasnella sp. 331]